jgi:hypothetical protein
MSDADINQMQAEEIADEELERTVLARFNELPDAIEMDIDAI